SAFYSSSLSTVRASSSLVLLSALLFYLSSASTSSYPLSLHDALPISGFVDSFVITTGSNRPLFQYGAETLAPFPFNHKKMPRLHGLMVRRTHTRTQDVLQRSEERRVGKECRYRRSPWQHTGNGRARAGRSQSTRHQQGARRS